MTDEELTSMLKAWKAPPAPASLEARVIRPQPLSRLRWLLSGDIRVPVPVALAALCVLLFVLYRAVRPPGASLSDFEHVQQFQPRIVRTVHETR